MEKSGSRDVPLRCEAKVQRVRGDARPVRRVGSHRVTLRIPSVFPVHGQVHFTAWHHRRSPFVPPSSWSCASRSATRGLIEKQVRIVARRVATLHAVVVGMSEGQVQRPDQERPFLISNIRFWEFVSADYSLLRNERQTKLARHHRDTRGTTTPYNNTTAILIWSQGCTCSFIIRKLPVEQAKDRKRNSGAEG